MNDCILCLLTLLILSSCGRNKSAKDINGRDSNTLMQVHELNSPQADIREFGQSIINGEIQPSDNNETFACLDSISSPNPSTRIFFFEVYRVIAKKADGALEEVVGVNLKHYFQTFPNEALNNFKRIDKSEQSLFINSVAFEFYLSETNFKTEIDSYFADIYKSCKNCRTDDKLLRLIKKRIIESATKMIE